MSLVRQNAALCGNGLNFMKVAMKSEVPVAFSHGAQARLLPVGEIL